MHHSPSSHLFCLKKIEYGCASLVDSKTHVNALLASFTFVSEEKMLIVRFCAVDNFHVIGIGVAGILRLL